MRKHKPEKSFFELSDAEKTEAVKEFDRPVPAHRMRPLNKKERLLWERARAHKPDVSIYIHEGETDIVIHLEPDIMAQARAYAAKNKTSLPAMIDRGLRGLLAFAG
jgi:hypothetical protein